MPDTQKLRRVFVVDDDPLISSTLAMILCSHGFDAASFTKPCEALTASQFEAPDLLISDVMMPVLSGIELATQMQETCPNCKVLLFSGQAGGSENEHRSEVFSKPVHPAELLRKIQSLSKQAPPPSSVNSIGRKGLYRRSA